MDKHQPTPFGKYGQLGKLIPTTAALINPDALEGYATGVGFGLINGQRDNGSVDLALFTTPKRSMKPAYQNDGSFEKLEAQLNTKGSQTVKEEHCPNGVLG